MTPPVEEVARDRSRQAYLQRLGIQSGVDVDRSVSEDSLSREGTTSDISSEDGMPTDDFRKRYLAKLAYNRVWVPQAHRSRKHQCVVIFDWDDTLLCTTYLRKKDENGHCVDEDVLRELANRAQTLLEMAISSGQTYIITNAMTGWVEYSAAKWVPSLLPILRKVSVISARDKFEAAFPDNVGQWKIQAFLEVQRQLEWTPITNLVALGDSHFEMEAARIMGGEFHEGLVKTVKFRPEPHLDEHLKQLDLVSNNLERIIGSAQSLKVCLERKR